MLFLLIPLPNFTLLKDLLGLLKRVAGFEESNKMSAVNLGELNKAN